MKINPLILILIVCTFFSCNNDSNEKNTGLDKTVLKGCVIGRDSDTLLLVKSIGDARSETIAKIPIYNWEFYYEFKTDTIEAYDLIFKEEHDDGGWMPMRFFSEKDTIRITLHSMEEFSENKLIGGKLNFEYSYFFNNISKPYQKNLDKVYKMFDSISYDKMNSRAYNRVVKKLKSSNTHEQNVVIYKEMNDLKKNNLHRSDLGKQIDSLVDIAQNKYLISKYNYIKKNPSIVSYSLLIDDIMGLEYNKVPKEKVILALNDLKKVYPNHPYTKLGENLWIGYTELKSGGQYINFSAPDINGISYELKPIVEANDIVLLDLWATWCGPCIARSRLIRPIYEKYKDKGFEILGVAGEHKNLDAYSEFMAKEQWPWLNLIELDKKNKIWEKYNVMNGGGGMFLIDKSGEILAVDPSAEEVEAILKEKLETNTLKV
ncbi:TlpA family protein disulfide reductase [Winogradskyella echinorum]|uniref:TlpA family protein disulfide reductase n=1 Tax=Winogradskyella echinorum TaxID=538189 RepID=A0ABR6Y4Y4_9FLAO|nr:TlpA disulfide reductase family protein [Winogradskyella echinorum]MBC3847808.1 TlpA family protein disulfide reductase [Winogradskyella echinorum]MBC5752156.1 TlpA family protein disulfide reductase [Winogradskyella echinorum]